ncbi:MAG: hypothetical protein K9K81_05675 [Desulfobacteraceae bacterium]|nr:hypothetical protein [Desulfobacteraceae bacterium]
MQEESPKGGGRIFSLLSLFADSADAFAEISKTRAFALKQFEIFRLRPRLNFPAKILNVASKTRPPALQPSLGTLLKFDNPVKHIGKLLLG